MIRFALVSLFTFAALGGAFFLSSSHAELKPATDTPSKFDTLFR